MFKIFQNDEHKPLLDTLKFFYLDNRVKVEAWQNIYADRSDKMAAAA